MEKKINMRANMINTVEILKDEFKEIFPKVERKEKEDIRRG